MVVWYEPIPFLDPKLWGIMCPSEGVMLCMHFTGFHLVRSKNCHVFRDEVILMWLLWVEFREKGCLCSAQKILNLVKEVNLTFKRGVCLNLFLRKLCMFFRCKLISLFKNWMSSFLPKYVVRHSLFMCVWRPFSVTCENYM